MEAGGGGMENDGARICTTYWNEYTKRRHPVWSPIRNHEERAEKQRRQTATAD